MKLKISHLFSFLLFFSPFLFFFYIALLFFLCFFLWESEKVRASDKIDIDIVIKIDIDLDLRKKKRKEKKTSKFRQAKQNPFKGIRD